MNKDVLLTIYEILHRDLTKQLNAEYHLGLYLGGINACACANNICNCYISIMFGGPGTMALGYNYRSDIYRATNIYTRYGKIRCHVSKNY